MVSSEQAETMGLALYIKDRTTYKTFILYDPKMFERWLRRELNIKLEDIIYAKFSIAKSKVCEAYEVVTASAKQGFGPLMYDIIMSKVGPVIPDRNSITPAAETFWKQVYFRFLRGEKYNATSLENTGCYEPRYDVHLNMAYEILRPVNFSSLVQKHIEQNWQSDELEILVNKGTDFFDRKYKGEI